MSTKSELASIAKNSRFIFSEVKRTENKKKEVAAFYKMLENKSSTKWAKWDDYDIKVRFYYQKEGELQKKYGFHEVALMMYRREQNDCLVCPLSDELVAQYDEECDEYVKLLGFEGAGIGERWE